MGIKALPYVYKCVHKLTGHFYIGFRCKNLIPSYQDILIYRTSSTYVNPHFDEFVIQIIAEFFNMQDAYDFEQLLIYENWKHPLLLNKSCYYGSLRFSTVGINHTKKTKQKISSSKKGKFQTIETKIKIGKKMLGNKNNINRVDFHHTDESKLKISSSKKGHNCQTLEHKEKLRNSNLGKRWYTNGEVNIKSIIPIDGFVLGRTVNKNRGLV